MKIAEAIDGKDVDEHGNEQNIRDEADGVACKICQEIHGSQEHGNRVDREHDYAC